MKPSSSDKRSGSAIHPRHQSYHNIDDHDVDRGQQHVVGHGSGGGRQGAAARSFRSHRSQSTSGSSTPFFQHLSHRWLPSGEARRIPPRHPSEMTITSYQHHHTATTMSPSASSPFLSSILFENVSEAQHREHHQLLVPRTTTNKTCTSCFYVWKRKLFLLITEPETSYASAVFFFIVIVAISLANIIGIMQTMEYWQFIPTDCISCGGNQTYAFEDDTFILYQTDDNTVDGKSSGGGGGSTPIIPCVCPPSPLPFTVNVVDLLMNFLAIEWILRILLFTPAGSSSSTLPSDHDSDDDNDNEYYYTDEEPPVDDDNDDDDDAPPTATTRHFLHQWFNYIFEQQNLLDALAVFPYYLERAPNGFVSLRLLRLFRLFQLVRLGQYNSMFMSLTNVLYKSFNYLKLLVLVLAFGAAFFGSMVYYIERGTWKYYEPAGEYRFVRIGVDGVTEEPTPFTSIPAAFWWFMVTATTVGYGDYYPTSTAGKWCATFAMLSGVLVIAFPVSVFSDLWSHELKKMDDFESHSSATTQINNNNDNAKVLSNVGASPNIADDTIGAAVAKPPPPLSLQDWKPSVAAVASEEGHSTAQMPGKRRIISMEDDDVSAIFQSLATIESEQQRIRSIMLKYDLVDTTATASSG